MFALNNRISKRQVMRLLTFDLLGYSALLIPSALAKVAGTDGIFSLLLGISAAFLYLILLKKVLILMPLTYSDYIRVTYGEIVGSTIKLGYLAYFILQAGRVAAIFSELVVKELLKEQFRLILLILLILTFYGVIGGIEGRARVYEILFFIVFVPLLLMMAATIPTVDTDYWQPIFVATKAGVLKGGYDTFSGCSILFLLPFLAEYVKKRECLYGAGKKALFITGGILTLLYLILLGMFGSNALATMDYPAVTMMSRVQITGGFLKRVDAIMFGIWFFTLYALLGSLVFFGGKLCTEILGATVESVLKGLYPKEERGEKQLQKVTVYLCVMAEVILVFFLADAYYGTEAVRKAYDNFFVYVGTPFVVVVPLLLVIRSKKKVILSSLGLLVWMLSACAPAEVEDREFPVLLEVEKEENFAKEWLNSLQQGNKKVDYNHLKVVLFSREFLENETAMEELLAILKQDKNVPLNAYIVATENFEELRKAEESMDEPLGDYLEKLLENAGTIKKETFPTIGMLYQEQENQMETLFIPIVTIKEDVPQITAYEVYKRGAAVGKVETDAALLAFFINNQLEEYVLQLGIKDFVRLSNTDNVLLFEEYIEKSGLIRRRVQVLISCQGEIIYEKIQGEGEEVTGFLEKQLVEYLKKTADEQLERGIDLTNSRKKLGGAMRSWYERYQNEPERYEKEIETVFDVKIRWVND